MSTETQVPHPIEYTNFSSAKSVVGPTAKEEKEISLLDLLIVLAERKRTILKVTVIFTVLAIVVSLVLPQRYTATVAMLPPQQNTSMASALSSQLGNLGGLAALAGGGNSLLKNPNDMYVSMFRSRTVEEAVAQRFGLVQEYRERYLSDASKMFEDRSKVDGTGKDNLLRISVEDRDPRRAAELANGYVEEFQKLTEHLAITEASQRRLFFEKQLIQAKDNLATAEEALKSTQQTTGMLELDSQARALIASDASLRAAIATREVEIEGMRAYATSENAQLTQAQRQLDSLREQLAKLDSAQDSGGNTLLIPKGRVPTAGLEYVRKLRDVKYNETIFEIIAKQFEAAKLDEAKEGSVVQIVDAAVPPIRRSFPKRTLIVLGAVGVGFLFGIFTALFQAGFQHLKSDPESAGKLQMLRMQLSFKRMNAS